MFGNMRSVVLAAGLALAPLSASAVTFDDGNSVAVGDLIQITNGGDAWSFAARFTPGDGPDSFSFIFENTTAVDRLVNFSATVNEGIAKFATGLQLSFGDIWLNSLEGGAADNVDGAVLIAAGSSETLTINFGEVVARNPTSGAHLNFAANVAPIPLPAAGVLLFGALGGLAALRRRGKSS